MVFLEPLHHKSPRVDSCDCHLHVRYLSSSSPKEWSYCCAVAAAEEQEAERIPGSSPHIPVRTRFAEEQVADKPAAAAAAAAAASSSRCFRKHNATNCMTEQVRRPASRQHSAGPARDRPAPEV